MCDGIYFRVVLEISEMRLIIFELLLRGEEKSPWEKREMRASALLSINLFRRTHTKYIRNTSCGPILSTPEHQGKGVRDFHNEFIAKFKSGKTCIFLLLIIPLIFQLSVMRDICYIIFPYRQ